MVITNAFKVKDKCTILTFDCEIDFRKKAILIDNDVFSFSYVHETTKSISIPTIQYDVQNLVGKKVEYFS